MLHGRETMTGLACLASLEVATVTSDFSLHQPPAETRPTQDFELAPTLMKVPPHFERILPENQKKSFFSLGGEEAYIYIGRWSNNIHNSVDKDIFIAINLWEKNLEPRSRAETARLVGRGGVRSLDNELADQLTIGSPGGEKFVSPCSRLSPSRKSLHDPNSWCLFNTLSGFTMRARSSCHRNF